MISRWLRRASWCALAVATPAAAQDNMNFEMPMAGERIPLWTGSTDPAATYRMTRDTVNPAQGEASGKLWSRGKPGAQEFGVIVRRIDATAYRGKRVRLRAMIRADVASDGHAALWLRADRPDGVGLFDNMSDRPIGTSGWRSYEIAGTVDPDATNLAFGLILTGEGSAWIDDVHIEIDGASATRFGTRTHQSLLNDHAPARLAAVPGDMPARALDPRGLANLTALGRAFGYVAHFDATDQAADADWSLVAIQAVEQVEPSKDPATLARNLNLALRPYAPDFCAYAKGGEAACTEPKPANATGALAWRHEGRQISTDGTYRSERVKIDAVADDRPLKLDLGGGVFARMPLGAWTGADGRTLARAPMPALPLARPDGWAPAGFDRSTRLADAIVAWNLFQHFYPYFDVVQADWPAELTRALESAATDADDKAFETTLRRLVHALQDGHGNVVYAATPTGQLQIVLDWIDGKVIVSAAAAEGAEGLKAGDEIRTIGGVAAADWIARDMERYSGSGQWRRQRALRWVTSGKPGDTLSLGWARPGAEGRATLAYVAKNFAEPRPATVSEVRPGIVYVDASRTRPEDWQAGEAALMAAKGIVIDVRGYPLGPPGFLSRLSATPFKSMPMHKPIITRPDRQGWEWTTDAWDMPANAPRYPGKIIFLTDERAISYAESVLQTVKGNKLGTIVGEPTAGTNGNINPTPLPGGYLLIWTGMQVVNLDGSQHHLRGVTPDVTVRRTLEGIRAGRDEVLEKGIALAGG